MPYLHRLAFSLYTRRDIDSDDSHAHSSCVLHSPLSCSECGRKLRTGHRADTRQTFFFSFFLLFTTDKLNSQSWTSSQTATGQGCAKIRRSTLLGGHLLAASATTQNVVATGEAEFYALTKSASRAPGAVAMAADMSKVVKPRVRVDATASEGDCLKARSGASETSPYPSLVGARGGGTP